jgi:hypothetical protein
LIHVHDVRTALPSVPLVDVDVDVDVDEMQSAARG